MVALVKLVDEEALRSTAKNRGCGALQASGRRAGFDRLASIEPLAEAEAEKDDREESITRGRTVFADPSKSQRGAALPFEE